MKTKKELFKKFITNKYFELNDMVISKILGSRGEDWFTDFVSKDKYSKELFEYHSDNIDMSFLLEVLKGLNDSNRETAKDPDLGDSILKRIEKKWFEEHELTIGEFHWLFRSINLGIYIKEKNFEEKEKERELQELKDKNKKELLKFRKDIRQERLQNKYNYPSPTGRNNKKDL